MPSRWTGPPTGVHNVMRQPVRQGGGQREGAPYCRAEALTLSAAAILPRGSWIANTRRPPLAAARRGIWSAEVTLAERTKNSASGGPGFDALPMRDHWTANASKLKCQRKRRPEPTEKGGGGGNGGVP